MEQVILAFLTGGFGIMVHTLMKINAINRRNKGRINLKKFFALEWPSIWMSVSVVIVAVIARQEIQQLKLIGNALLLGFFCIGLSAQSIAYYLANRGERTMGGKEQEREPNIEEIKDCINEIEDLKDVINEIGAGQVGLPQVPTTPGK